MGFHQEIGKTHQLQQANLPTWAILKPQKDGAILAMAGTNSGVDLQVVLGTPIEAHSCKNSLVEANRIPMGLMLLRKLFEPKSTIGRAVELTIHEAKVVPHLIQLLVHLPGITPMGKSAKPRVDNNLGRWSQGEKMIFSESPIG